MSVPTGGSRWSHANNKAVMLLKCSGARLKCGRIFFFSVKCPHVDSWSFNGPLNCSGPFIPEHHCKLMLRRQCFYFECFPLSSFTSNTFSSSCDCNFAVDSSVWRAENHRVEIFENQPFSSQSIECVLSPAIWRAQDDVFGGLRDYKVLNYSSGWNAFIKIWSQAWDFRQKSVLEIPLALFTCHMVISWFIVIDVEGLRGLNISMQIGSIGFSSVFT